MYYGDGGGERVGERETKRPSAFAGDPERDRDGERDT